METHFHWILLKLLIEACFTIGQQQDNALTLSSSKQAVEENSSVALTCSRDTTEVWASRWSTSQYENKYALCTKKDNMCFKTSFLNDSAVYECICNNNGSYTVLLKKVNRFQHTFKWTCSYLNFNSNTVVINVSVPVETLEIMDTNKGYKAENQKFDFRCKSSFSRPKQDLYWFLNNGTPDFHDDERIISNNTESIVNETIGNKTGNILTSTESTLTLNVQRSMNNQQIYCLTNDTSGRVIRSTMEILNVSYPPDEPPYIEAFRNNGTYDVINKTQGNLSCIVTGGNPLPTLNWTCFQSGTQTMWQSSTTVTSYFTWTASIDNNKKYCTCQSQYIGGQSSAFVSINVLYPPSLPDFYIQITNGSWNTVSSKINITENSILTMKCSSKSNPVSNYSWTGPKTSHNETLIWNVVNNKTEGSYTCTAINNMTLTNSPRLEGKTNNSILVNVLYPPSDIAFTLRNQTTNIYVTETVNMFENVSYILTCHARGKPGPAYKWTGPLSLKSNILNLTNINRNKTGYYTCEAENIIYESTGVIHNGRENKSLYLNIQYASEVTEFFIDGHREDNTIITNQGENVTFHCNIDSNPNSSVSLLFKDEYLKNNTNTRNLTHLVENLPCSSAGIYYCFSSNEVNYGKLSWKRFILIVKCPPLPEKNLKFNVTTLKYVPATLSFKAMDFLDSDKTSFTWEKQNNASKWKTVKNDTQVVNISTFNLQTNLTVLNVTRHFSGYYRVIYNNSVGGNTQMFQLSVADIPDAPTYFDYLKESLTFTQVTVFWTKGFGGGLRQTFVLNIFQTSQLVKYDYINETENELMKHTITGLSSGTQYDLTLWATNSVGKSLSQTLTILTKEVDVHSSATLTAPIAGSVSSVVAIVAGFFVAFMLCKRRLKQKTDSNNGDRSYANICGMKTKSGGNSTNCEPVYEGVKPIHERGYVEMKEQTYDKIKLADSPEIKDPIYTNLKL